MLGEMDRNLSQPYYIEPRKGRNHLDLCGEWEYGYREVCVSDILQIQWTYKTLIPNSIYWSLHESGVLPHPYQECNSKLYDWVDEKVWYYRKKFYLDTDQCLGDGFLCVDGAAYYSRVWVNGSFIGYHEGMFGGPIVEIGKYLQGGSENEIIIEIRPCNYGIKQGWDSRNIAGSNRVIVPWNLARDDKTSNGDFIVIGLWRGVRIEFLQKLHLSRPHLFTESISDTQAKLHFSCEIANDSIQELQVTQDYTSDCNGYTRAYDNGLTGIRREDKIEIVIEICEKVGGKRVYLEKEEISLYDYEKSGIDPQYYECQFYNKEIVIQKPKLWFPHDMGEPFLYHVKITLFQDHRLYDTHEFDFGVRTVELETSAGGQYRGRWGKFQFVINGERIFLKGMNWMPIDFLLKLQEEEYRWLLTLAKDAGIQLLRVWSGGGIPETDEFYKLCDEMGIMVWQDSFIANMETPNWPQDILQAQVSMNLYRIRNHPALIMHCGGNEFNPYAFGNAASMFVIERNVTDLDPSRPFVRTTADQGSAHVYRDMEPTWYRHLYKQLPFLAESGIHSFPNIKSIRQMISQEEFQKPLSDVFSPSFPHMHPELLHHFTEYIPERVPRMLARASYICSMENVSMEDLVEATQISACEFYQIMIQAMRENYPITTGIMPWAFKRPWTTVGIQLVDGMGDPTASYYYVKNAYQSLIATVCLEHLTYAPGERIGLGGKIIYDGRESIPDAVLILQVLDPQMQIAYEKKQSISIESKTCENVLETERFEIPEEYADTFFFVRIVVKRNERILCQSMYWPKCLTQMKNKELREKYRKSPQENFLLDKGPWLKKQIQMAPEAELSCEMISTIENNGRIAIALRIINHSSNPVFPVRVDPDNNGTLCRASDNYFFMEPREVKNMKLEIYNKNPGLDRIDLQITAWNARKIVHIIDLRGERNDSDRIPTL